MKISNVILAVVMLLSGQAGFTQPSGHHADTPPRLELLTPAQQPRLEPNGTLTLPDGTLLLTTPPAPNDTPAILHTRIALDIKSVRIEEALKKLFALVDLRFELDRDVNTTKRVSLRVHNISFLTALNVLMEETDLGWTMSTEQAGQMNRPFFRIGKTRSRSVELPLQLEWHNDYQWLPGTQNGLQWIPLRPNQLQWTAPLKLNGNPLSSSDLFWVDPVPDTTSVRPNGIAPSPPVPNGIETKPGAAGNRGIPILSDLPLIGRLFQLRAQEERDIFTCPHCHHQITIIRNVQQPKCPECGRVFQPDWNHCPYDGAKRPILTGFWKVCPVCGKEIPTSDLKH